MLLSIFVRVIIKVRNVKISSMDSTKANPIASRVGFFLHSLRLRACGLVWQLAYLSSFSSNQRENSSRTIPTIVGATSNVKISCSMDSTPLSGQVAVDKYSILAFVFNIAVCFVNYSSSVFYPCFICFGVCRACPARAIASFIWSRLLTVPTISNQSLYSLSIPHFPANGAKRLSFDLFKWFWKLA